MTAVPQSTVQAAVEALTYMVCEQVDYMTRNRLGDAMQQHGVKLANAAIALLRAALEAREEQSRPLNGIAANDYHDEGAIARCSYCGRYSLDRNTLSENRHQPVCDCGKKHGWSGSFKKPGPDAKWSGRVPEKLAASPVAADTQGDAWQPIETAPKDGSEIILGRGSRVTAGHWMEEKEELASEYHANGTYLGQYPSGIVHDACWLSWDGGFTEEEPPTHWMPLPPPPVAAMKEQPSDGVNAVLTRHCTAHPDEIPPMGETVLSPLFDAARGVNASPEPSNKGGA